MTAVVLFLGQFAHLIFVVVTCDRQTAGVRYFEKSPREKLRFKNWLKIQRVVLSPIIFLLSKVNRFNPNASSLKFPIREKETANKNSDSNAQTVLIPKGMCNEQSVNFASEYLPSASDLFVATQMRSGTTWMQNIIYQLLTRGADEPFQKSLNQISPWLEASKTVSIERAALLGNRSSRRIIKTHLPASLTPFSTEAKYVYVYRHPVSCGASTIDFLRSNMGPFSPNEKEFADWFCSDQMWFGSWPDHISGWLSVADSNPNVHVVKFEELKEDFAHELEKINQFLELPELTASQLKLISDNCTFQKMKQHAEFFEMSPPHLFQQHERFFVSGRVNRHRDLSEQTGKKIWTWCKNRLAEKSLDIDDLYSET